MSAAAAFGAPMMFDRQRVKNTGGAAVQSARCRALKVDENNSRPKHNTTEQ